MRKFSSTEFSEKKLESATLSVFYDTDVHDVFCFHSPLISLLLKAISSALFLPCSGSGFRILLFYCAIFDLV